MTDFVYDETEEKPHTFWTKVALSMPTGSVTKQFHISLEIEEISTNDIESLSDDDQDDIDLLIAKTKNWKGINDPKGEPVEYSEERFLKLLNKMWFRRGCIDAVLARNSGGKTRGKKDRRTKN